MFTACYADGSLTWQAVLMLVTIAFICGCIGAEYRAGKRRRARGLSGRRYWMVDVRRIEDQR